MGVAPSRHLSDQQSLTTMQAAMNTPLIAQLAVASEIAAQGFGSHANCVWSRCQSSVA